MPVVRRLTRISIISGRSVSTRHAGSALKPGDTHDDRGSSARTITG